MTHKFNCFEGIQMYAICEFNQYKKAIDEIEEIADNNYEKPEMELIFKIIGGLDV